MNEQTKQSIHWRCPKLKNNSKLFRFDDDICEWSSKETCLQMLAGGWKQLKYCYVLRKTVQTYWWSGIQQYRLAIPKIRYSESPLCRYVLQC